MLTARYIQNFLVIHQFTKGDVVQEAGQAIAQIASPDCVKMDWFPAFVAQAAVICWVKTRAVLRLAKSLVRLTNPLTRPVARGKVAASWQPPFPWQRVASTDSSTALMTSPTAILPASLPSR